MLEIAVCSLIMLIDYLTNVDILGQGNLNLVSEKSGKCQGILLSIICGNPEWGVHTLYGSHVKKAVLLNWEQSVIMCNSCQLMSVK